MDKSVTMLAEQHSSGPRHVFLHGLQAGLASKLSFAEALKTQNSALASDLELSLIDSGERSGRLAQACEHLAHYFETWDKGIREARGALIYPLLLMHVGVILPEISRYMMLSAIKEIAILPAILWRLGLFWTGLFLIWALWKSLSRSATRSEATDRALNTLPLYRLRAPTLGACALLPSLPQRPARRHAHLRVSAHVGRRLSRAAP